MDRSPDLIFENTWFGELRDTFWRRTMIYVNSQTGAKMAAAARSGLLYMDLLSSGLKCFQFPIPRCDPASNRIRPLASELPEN